MTPAVAPITSTVRSAISAELRVSAAGIPFKASTVIVNGGMLTVELEPINPRSSLDESMEEGRLGWKGDTEGWAEIVSVLPSLSCIHAYFTSGRPPARGEIIFVNPPRFLEPLLKIWEGRATDANVVRWFQKIKENKFDAALAVTPRNIHGLRPAQLAAFSLPGWEISFLWGPPGTGKTHTLGELLATYLIQHPSHRVLVPSATNVAVDFAVLAVDKALGPATPNKPRPSCLRFGSRFDPKRYEGRQHLIPVKDKTLIRLYEAHLQVAPDPAEPEKYKAWKDKLEALRKQIREQNLQYLATAALAAMTTTYAIFEHDSLVGGKYDLVVFDEASQVSKVHAITLASLGKRVMFAGDPRQLSPIVQANSEDARSWLGLSPFDWEERTNSRARCKLDEQWRMAEPISRAVSKLFYREQLRVAEPALADLKWLSERAARSTRLLPGSNVVLLNTFASAEPAKQFVGYICRATAELAAAVALDLHHSCPEESTLILTPYRAQRRTIQAELQSVNLPSSIVSTVHRAQGSERRNVILDLVKAGAEFVNGPEGRRLINVAISRAECRLIILLQMDWQDNPLLATLAGMFQRIDVPSSVVQQTLLLKLAPRKSQGAAPIPPPKPQPPAPRLTLAEEFHLELLQELRIGPRTSTHRKWFARELAGRLKYHKKLSFAEIQRETELVMSKLPRIS